MSDGKSAARRLLTFVFTTGLGSLVTVISMPVIIGGAGAQAWGVQAAIQSAAGLFGVLVSFGWGTTGAAQVAAMAPSERPRWYLGSLTTRLYLFVIAYPTMVALMIALNPSYMVLVVIASAAYLIPSISASWYYIGEARPDRLFRLDVLPQVAGILASLVVMVMTGSLAATMAVQLAFNSAVPLLAARVIRREGSSPIAFDWSVRHAAGRLGGQRHAVVTAATSAVYVSSPILILNAISPTALPLYAMGDKLFRFALTVFAPVLQFVQGWIPEKGVALIPQRIAVASRYVPWIAGAGALTVFAAGPFAASLLSAGEVVFGFDLSLPFAIVLFAVCLSQILGLAFLIQLGRVRDLARSTVVGALTGLPLLVVGAVLFSVHGIAWAMAISELVVLVYQAMVVTRELRRRADEDPQAPGADDRPVYD